MASIAVQNDDYVDITPKQDGGVLKLVLHTAVTRTVQQTNPAYEEWQILRQKEQKEDKPQSCEAPEKFVEVTIVPEPCVPGPCEVHYTGTLDQSGEEFDTSRKFGSSYSNPFKFNAGDGSVVKGFDIAVLSMMSGERAEFKIRADYGYGDAGMEGEGLAPDILPGDTLVFDMELMTVGVQGTKDRFLVLEERRLEELKEKRKLAEAEKLAKVAKRKKDKEQAALDRVTKLKNKKEKGRKEKKESKTTSVDTGGSMTKKDVQKMKPKDLKSHLKQLGESTQGNKKELLARLMAKLRL
jgi:FKBP-type peptidyl-prolyl cis-trans isomerase